MFDISDKQILKSAVAQLISLSAVIVDAVQPPNTRRQHPMHTDPRAPQGGYRRLCRCCSRTARRLLPRLPVPRSRFTPPPSAAA